MDRPAFASFASTAERSKGVLGYVRVSSPDQAQRRASLEEQKRRVSEHFEAHLGLSILRWYVDEGKSAHKDHENRAEFWKMIEHAKSDPAVGILAMDEESRFLRDRYLAPAVKGQLLENGVVVHTCTRNTDPRTVAGLWQESIEETMAHAGSMQNRQYTLRGMAGNVHLRDPDTGWAFKNGGQAPYGWISKRIDMGRDSRGRPIGRTIWLLDDEKARVRKQVLLRRKEGWTYDAIRDELNRRKIPAPRSRLWSGSTIVGMCREDMVWTAAGYTVWNKHHRKQPVKGEKFKPSSEWEVEPNAHPAIISEDDAKAIVALNRDRRRENTHGRKNQVSPYLLKGESRDGGPLFVCGVCGARMVGEKAGRGRRKYICSTKAYKGSRHCVSERVDALDLEARVVDVLAARFTPAYVRQVIAAVNEAVSRQERPKTKDIRQRRLGEIDSRMERIRQSIMAGFDPGEWVDEMRTLREERNDLARSIEDDPGEEPAALQPIDPAAVERVGLELVEALRTGETKERRRVVRALVKQVTLSPKQEAVFLELHPDPLDIDAPTLFMYRDRVVPPTRRDPIAIPERQRLRLIRKNSRPAGRNLTSGGRT